MTKATETPSMAIMNWIIILTTWICETIHMASCSDVEQ